MSRAWWARGAEAWAYVVAVAVGACQLPTTATFDAGWTSAMEASSADVSPDDSGSVAPARDAGAPDATPSLTVGSCGTVPRPPTSGLCRTTAGVTWCWENPIPMGETIQALAGTSADDVWALTNTMVLHGVNGQWTDTMDGSFLNGGLYAAGPADVWLAAGFRTSTSSPPPSGPYQYTAPAIWHWDGQAWTVAYSFAFVPDATLWLTGIWASSRRDVWATADGSGGGAVMHFDGASWSQVSASALPNQALDDIWGSGPDDIWTLSSVRAGLIHFDGTSWSGAGQPPGESSNHSLSGTGARDVWLGQMYGVTHFDGTGWTSYPQTAVGSDAGIFTPVALAPGDVWALSWLPTYPAWNCIANRWDGTQWMPASVMAEPSSGACYQAATGWPQGGLVAGGGNGRLDVLTCSGQFKSMVGKTTLEELDAVWGSSTTDLWTVGKNGTILHGNGTESWVRFSAPTSADLTALWGAAWNDVWAVGQGGTAIHWNGSQWTQWPTGTGEDLVAISGSSSDNVWAVSAGQMLRFDGTSWSLVRSEPGSSYADIAVVAADDVWITGAPSFLHWNGSAFESVPSPGPGDVSPRFIKAYARDDIWADSGMRWVFHYDGATWSVVAAGGEYHSGQELGYGPFIGKIAGDPNDPPYFLMDGEVAADGDIARVDSSGAVTAMPKLYVGTQYNGVFVLDRQVWLVGIGGAIEHGFIPVD